MIFVKVVKAWAMTEGHSPVPYDGDQTAHCGTPLRHPVVSGRTCLRSWIYSTIPLLHWFFFKYAG